MLLLLMFTIQIQRLLQLVLVTGELHVMVHAAGLGEPGPALQQARGIYSVESISKIKIKPYQQNLWGCPSSLFG